MSGHITDFALDNDFEQILKLCKELEYLVDSDGYIDVTDESVERLMVEVEYVDETNY